MQSLRVGSAMKTLLQICKSKFLILTHEFSFADLTPSLSAAQIAFGASHGMSMGELRETSAILIPAGSETSATGLAGTIRLLIKNPSKLQILKDQIRTSFASEQDITIQNVRTRLPYLLGVIEEGLRLFPPAPVSFSTYRIVPDKGATIAGRYVPGKTAVAVSSWAAFRSGRNFVDPLEYVPERWLEGKDCPEKYRNDKRKVVQPFSVGPRGCIGQRLAYAEMGLILARIWWNFDIELCDNDELWAFEKKTSVWVVWDHQPLMVRVTPVKR